MPEMESGNKPDRELTKLFDHIKSIASDDSRASGFASHRMDQDPMFKVAEQAGHMIEMIHHFRSILNAGARKEKRLGQSSVQDSLRHVLHAMQYEFPFPHVAILKIIPHDLGPLALPHEHLEIMLFQLIRRAHCALDGKPGVITIEAQEEYILTRENKSHRRISIRVSDTAIPIPEEDLPNLFDPLFALSEREPDSGICLYLVKRLVELNHGSLSVMTSPRGTSFHIILPGAA